MQQAMRLAWESVCAGSFGIGAVITTAAGEPVSTGRNRILESTPGDDVLHGTSLAHAEMNALAKLRYGVHSDAGLVLYTTLEPCLQCIGAIRMSWVGDVRVLAPDPLFCGLDAIADINEHAGSRWPTVERWPATEWSVFSLLLPTHLGAFWGQHPPRWREAIPATCALADDLVSTGALVDAAAARADVADVANDLWPRLSDGVDELQRLIPQRR